MAWESRGEEQREKFREAGEDAKMAGLRAELKEAKRDTARLDWLLAQEAAYWVVAGYGHGWQLIETDYVQTRVIGEGATQRAAIDQAMAAKKKAQGL